MNKLWVILIFGVLIRLLLSFSTFHPDIGAFSLGGKLIAEGNILNLYDYLSELPLDDPIKNLAIFNYPPAIYWFHGFFNFLFSNVFGLSLVNQFLLDAPSNYGNILFNIRLLLIKLPYLIFDIFIGLILLKLFNFKRQSKLAFTFWMFNPLNLYATYMMGQFDIIPTFFSVLSIYLIFKNKLSLAALSLGGGIAFKIFPIFFLIPLIFLEKNIWHKFKLIALAILPYLVSILPYLQSYNFRSVALFANQNSKSLYAQIPISGGEALVLFPMFLLLTYLIMWRLGRTMVMWQIYLIILLLFFTFTHYHPQWLLWLTPFIILDLISRQFKNMLPVTLILLSYIGSLFFFDPSLTLGIFAPLVPSLHNVPSLWTLLNINLDYNFSRSLLQTVFAASTLYIIYDHYPKKSNG